MTVSDLLAFPFTSPLTQAEAAQLIRMRDALREQQGEIERLRKELRETAETRDDILAGYVETRDDILAGYVKLRKKLRQWDAIAERDHGKPICQCTHEAGDSVCEVHPGCDECGADTERPMKWCSEHLGGGTK